MIAAWKNNRTGEVVVATHKKPKWIWGGYPTDHTSQQLSREPLWSWKVPYRQRCSIDKMSQVLRSFLKPPWQAKSLLHTDLPVWVIHITLWQNYKLPRTLHIHHISSIHKISNVLSVSTDSLIFLSNSPFVGSSGMDKVWPPMLKSLSFPTPAPGNS